MEIKRNSKKAEGVRLSIEHNGIELAHAFLYVMHNDLHNEPFGLMEDVFVDENYRGKGYGTQLVKKIIEIAREYRCYKLIATSRSSKPKVHELYQRLGFEEHGVEFRINLL
ncbi:GNAT family N-acetyltransferase [Brasilonema sp. UFV-L1]|uniref:GNAT family N-acetyltransferase n=1 Tax=Brasilonema sp. UFV-L1 TaxID=2234130 RepID=UPI001B7CF0CA